jgi:hypothetical protein
MRGWLASSHSKQIRSLVPDGLFDRPPVHQVAVLGNRYSLFGGWLNAPTVTVPLTATALEEMLDRSEDELIRRGLRLLLGALVISDYMVERSAIGQELWPAHIGGAIECPDDETFARLSAGVVMDDAVLTTQGVARSDIAPLIRQPGYPDEYFPLAQMDRRLIVASPHDLLRAAIGRTLQLAESSPRSAELGERLASNAWQLVIAACEDMLWKREGAVGGSELFRIDVDKLAAVQVVRPLRPVGGHSLEAATRDAAQSIIDLAKDNPEIVLGVVVSLADDSTSGDVDVRTLPDKNGFGPWVLTAGEFQLFADALRADPLGLRRMFARAPAPPYPVGAAVTDAVGHLRLREEPHESRDGFADGTEYLHKRARFMAGRHPAPDASGERFITVTRWRHAAYPAVFSAERPSSKFQLLIRAPGVFCWVETDQEVRGSHDLPAVLVQLCAFWLAQLARLDVLSLRDAEASLSVSIDFIDEPTSCLAAVPRETGLRLVVGPNFVELMARPDNCSDRTIIAVLLHVLLPQGSGVRTEPIMDTIAPLGPGTFLRWPSKDARCIGPRPEPPDIIPGLDRLQVDIELAANLLGPEAFNQPQILSVGSDRAQEVINQAVSVLLALIDHALTPCSPELLTELVAQDDRANTLEETEGLLSPIKQALPLAVDAFGETEHTSELALGIRFLMERVSAAPPDGEQAASRELLVRLRALAETVVRYGAISDAIHAGIATANVVFIPSYGMVVTADGPGLTSRERQVTETGAAAPGRVLESHPEWSFDPSDKVLPPLDDPLPQDGIHWADLDDALADSVGYSFDELVRVLVALSRIADKQETGIHVLRLDAATRAVQMLTAIEPARIERIVHASSLRPEPHYDPVSKAHKPWEPNRERAFARLPLVVLPTGELCWSATATIRAARHLLGLVTSGRFRGSPRVSRAVGKLAQEADAAFEREVVLACRSLGYRARGNVRKFAGIRPTRANGEMIGEIDALAVDADEARVWLLEAKRLTPSYAPLSLPREVEYLRRAVKHHRERLQWVRGHPRELETEIGAAPIGRAWRITAALITDAPLAGAYFDRFDLPIWPIDRLSSALDADTTTSA